MAAYSGLSEAQRERFEMLAEEAAEVIHAVTKILRHGRVTTDHVPPMPVLKNNISDLEKEVGQFYGIAKHMMKLGDLSMSHVQTVADMAWDKKKVYTHHQDEE